MKPYYPPSCSERKLSQLLRETTFQIIFYPGGQLYSVYKRFLLRAEVEGVRLDAGKAQRTGLREGKLTEKLRQVKVAEA